MIDGKMSNSSEECRDLNQIILISHSRTSSYVNVYLKKILIRLWLHDQVSCIMKGVLYSIVLLFEIWQLDMSFAH